MIHLHLASLKGPMNIVAMDSQEESIRYEIVMLLVLFI
jgi:hypothetical protein